MSARAITPPYPVFNDSDGTPLENGFIYIGVENLDPVTNPISIYWDESLTIPALQPVRTLNGYPSRAGSPAQFFAGSRYSILVNNKNGVAVYSSSSSATTLADDLLNSDSGKGASLVTYLDSYIGAVATTVWDVLSERISVTRFMTVAQVANVKAGIGGVDCTEAIQNAINAASKSSHRSVYFPAGRYDYTRLYCFYDAVLNPGFKSSGRQANITFIGDGITMPYHSRIGGSVLYCTSTTGDGIAVSPIALDGGSYDANGFHAEGISFEGAISGYIMSAYGVPNFRMTGCQFVQGHSSGGGLRLSSAWVGLLEKVNFATYPFGFTTSGKAIAFSATIPGGLLTLRDCTTSDKYAYGLHHLSGGWQQLSIVDSEIAGSSHAIYVSDQLQLLSIRGSYFEGACTSFIADAGAACISELSVKDSWFLSGSLTGAAINLQAPNCVDISACLVQDQEASGKAFLNIQAVVQPGQTQPHRVSGVTFTRYAPAVATTLFTGIIPKLDGIDYYLGNALTTLHTAGKHPIRSYVDGSSNGYQYAAHMCETKILDYGGVLGSLVAILSTDAAPGIPAFVKWYCASGNPTFRLPSAAYMAASYLGAGVGITLTNDMNSASYGIVTNGEGSPTTIGNVQPGDQRKFVWSGTAWI